MVMEDFFNIFFGFVAGLLLSLVLFAATDTGSEIFSRPYRDLVEAMCPETDPDVYIDSNKIIRIVYDCSQE